MLCAGHAVRWGSRALGKPCVGEALCGDVRLVLGGLSRSLLAVTASVAAGAGEPHLEALGVAVDAVQGLDPQALLLG